MVSSFSGWIPAASTRPAAQISQKRSTLCTLGTENHQDAMCTCPTFVTILLKELIKTHEDGKRPSRTADDLPGVGHCKNLLLLLP